MKTNERRIETVTNAITTMVNQVERDARMETLDEMHRILHAKAKMIEKVLDNGTDIWLASSRNRRENLYQLRQILWNHAILLHRLASEVITLKYKD